MKRAAFVLLLLCVQPALAGDAVSGLVLPAGTDEYAQLVARAAKGDKNVDFHALRIAYLNSAARAAENPAEIAQLKDAMVQAIDAKDNTKVRDIAVQILSKRWVDIDVHAVLITACDLLKDDACAAQSQFALDGLMKSILTSGTGKGCAKGWEVINAREEYVVMAMQDADIKDSSFDQEDGHTCQVLVASDGKGGTQTYYFNIDLVRADISAQMAKAPVTAAPAASAPASTPPPALPLRPAGK